jgi:hypothetical protein
MTNRQEAYEELTRAVDLILQETLLLQQARIAKAIDSSHKINNLIITFKDDGHSFTKDESSSLSAKLLFILGGK